MHLLCSRNPPPCDDPDHAGQWPERVDVSAPWEAERKAGSGSKPASREATAGPVWWPPGIPPKLAATCEPCSRPAKTRLLIGAPRARPLIGIRFHFGAMIRHTAI